VFASAQVLAPNTLLGKDRLLDTMGRHNKRSTRQALRSANAVVGETVSTKEHVPKLRECVSLQDSDSFDDIIRNPDKYTPEGYDNPIDAVKILECLTAPGKGIMSQGIVIHGPASPLTTTAVYKEVDESDANVTVRDPWGSPVETGPGWLAYMRSYPAGSMLKLYTTGEMPRLVLIKHACIDQVRTNVSIIMTTNTTTHAGDKAYAGACDVISRPVLYRPWLPLTTVRDYRRATPETIRSLYNLNKQCTMIPPDIGYKRTLPNAECTSSQHEAVGVFPFCPSSGVHNVVGQLFGISSLVDDVTKEGLAHATMHDNVPEAIASHIGNAIGVLHGVERDRKCDWRSAVFSMDLARSVMRALDLSTVCALWACTATRVALPMKLNSPTGAPLVLALCVRLATNEDLCMANNPHFSNLLPPRSERCRSALSKMDKMFRMQFPPLTEKPQIQCAIDLLWTMSILEPPSYKTNAERAVFHKLLWKHIAELVLRGRGLAEALFGPEDASGGWADSIDNGHCDPLGLDLLCTRPEAADAALRMMVMVERFCRDGTWPSKGALSALSVTEVEDGDRDGKLACALTDYPHRPVCPFVNTHHPDATRNVAHKLLFDDCAPFGLPPPPEDTGVLHPNAHICESATHLLLYGGCESQYIGVEAFLVSANQYSHCAREECTGVILPLKTVPFSSHGRCCATCNRFFCEHCFFSLTSKLPSETLPMHDCSSCAAVKESVCASLPETQHSDSTSQ